MVTCFQNGIWLCQGSKVYGQVWISFGNFSHASTWPLAFIFPSWHEGSHDGTDALNGNRQRRCSSKVRTARLARACLTILWEASPLAGADITLTSGNLRGRYVATLCPSEGRWYQRFETGINARMGDVVSQDRAYTVEIVLALLDMYEAEWKEHRYQMPLVSMYSVMLLLITCLGGM